MNSALIVRANESIRKSEELLAELELKDAARAKAKHYLIENGYGCEIHIDTDEISGWNELPDDHPNSHCIMISTKSGKIWDCGSWGEPDFIIDTIEL